MRWLWVTLGVWLVGTLPALAADAPVDFKAAVLPILERACVDCHGPQKASGGLQLGSGAHLLSGGISGKAVVPGHPVDSYLMERILGQGGEDQMPLKADPLSAEDIDVIRRWIAQGALVPAEKPKPFAPEPAGLRRLTLVQYRNTLKDLFGDKVELPADIEPDMMVSGSAAVGAARVSMSRRATEQFGVAAYKIAAAALADEKFRSQWLACAADDAAAGKALRAGNNACVADFVVRFGRRAWRRPLGPDEIDRYTRLGRVAAGRTDNTQKAAEAVIAALLQSPNFLFRVELGSPDKTNPARRVLSDFEMASRLSYFLWGAPPDEALLDAAASGQLGQDDGLRAEAERMMTSPRARATMQAFFTELLRLRRLDRLQQFRSAFSQQSRTLGQSMRTETLKVIEEIAFDATRDFREIFDSRFTYVNGELAKLYGLPPPEDDAAFTRVELPAGASRAGILGHASFLALNAHPTSSSPTKRGKFIREVLLCQAVPPPPPNVSTKLPEDHEDGVARTTRQKLDGHRTTPQCMGCHKAMDPMGLAFESFDGIGAFRETENGQLIDTTGELDGVPFKHAGELGTLLRQSPKVGVCVARGLYRYAMGHLESEGEEPLLQELARGLESEGYHFRSLILAVVKSQGFRYVSEPK